MTAGVSFSFPTEVYGGSCATGPYAADYYSGCENSGSITSLTNSGGSITAAYSGGSHTTIGSIISGAHYGILNDGASSTIGTLINSGTIKSIIYDGIGNYSGGYIGELINTGNGTIIGTGTDGVYNASGTISILSNSGLISGGRSAIENYDTLGALSNAGIIRGDLNYGFFNTGRIGTLSNSGTIKGGLVDIYNKEGTIAVLNNLQGAGNGEGALTYAGKLATEYNVIIYSSTHYGELDAVTPTIGGSVSTISGTMAFSIASSSFLTDTTYTSVLQGITASELASGTTGTIDGFTYTLSSEIGAPTNWDLILNTTAGAYGTILNSTIATNYTNNSALLSGTVAGLLNSGITGVLTNNSGNTITGGSTGVRNIGSIGSLVNAGAITGPIGIKNTSVGAIGGSNVATAINNSGSISSLVNSGTISGTAAGIYNQGGVIGGAAFATAINNSGLISSLVNSGTIIGSAVDINNNSGTIGVLNNLQGVSGTTSNALSYSGNLANHYTVIIDSPTLYGELSAESTVTGTMAFGIAEGSTLTQTIYTDVLEGFSGSIVGSGISESIVGSGFTVTNINGALDGRSYSLVQETNSGNWDLVFAAAVAYGTIISSGSIVPTLTNTEVFAGTIAGVSNAGTIGGLGNSGILNGGWTGVFNSGTIGTLGNTGTISGGTLGVCNDGTIGALSNSGTISSRTVGIYNDGTIETFTNSGMISGGYAGIHNVGAIGVLSNLQGAVENNALTYTGTLASSYNVIIDSSTNYGELAVSSITGEMAFGIDSSSRLTAGTLTDVLQGFGTLSGYVTNTTGTVGQFSYALVADTLQSGDWNLVLTHTLAYGTINYDSISTLTNSGTLSGTIAGLLNSGITGVLTNNSGNTITGGSTGVRNIGSIGSLVNAGAITGPIGIKNTSVGAIGGSNVATAINNSGSISSLVNSGTISGTAAGIYNQGGVIGGAAFATAINNSGLISSLVNSGTIIGSAVDINNNSGTIGVLNNLQGVSGTTSNALSYSGNLANHYTVIIDSPTLYGELSAESTVTGTMAFGIAEGSTLTQTIYTDVLEGFSGSIVGSGISESIVGSGFTVTNINGALDGRSYSLVQETNSGNWDLVFAAAVAYGTIISSGSIVPTLTNTEVFAGTIAGVSNAGTIGGLGNSGILNGGWTGVFNSGTIGTLGNTGTISGGTLGVCNDGTIGALSNSGTISSRTVGIYNDGTIETFTNSGMISGGYVGIYNDGTIETFTNSGMISGGYAGIYNSGVIGVLNNLQGAGNTAGALTYLEALPQSYNVIIYAPTLYGELSASSLMGISGTMTFGVDLALSTLTAGTLANVLEGFVGTLDNGTLIGSGFEITNLTGTAGSFNYSLVETNSTLGDWSLILASANTSAYGTINSGSTPTLTNTGTLTGTMAGVNNTGTVGTLSNSGYISGGGTGIFNNNGTINSIANSGTITGSNYAIRSTGGHLGDITNNGLISGNISVTGQNLTISGASGSGQGTLAGGEITLDPTKTLTFGGNILLEDSIDPLAIINTGNLQVNTTQNLVGNFTQTSSGNLLVGINSGSSGQLAITGAASLAGGVQAIVASDVSVNGGKRYTILSATNGVTRSFSGVTTNLTNLTLAQAVLSYDANDAYLGFQANYTRAATNQNQIAVASGLTTAFNSTPSAAGQTILNSLNTATTAQAQSAFNSLSGEGISAQQSANFEATELAVDTARRQGTYWLMDECQTGASSKKNNALPANALPMTCSSNDNRQFRSWVAGVGGSNSMSGSSTVGSSAVSSQTGGGLAGFDYEVSPNLLVGMMAGATSSNYNVSNLSSSGSIASGQFGVYSVAKWNRFYMNTVFDYGYFSNASTRYVNVGGSTKETSSNNSNAFTGRAEVGYRVEHPVVNMMPFIAMQATSLQMGTYSESNTNGLGLNIQSKNVMSEPGSLGVQLDKAYDLDKEWSLYPLLRMAWIHEFQTTRTVTASLQSLPTGGWTVSGASAAANAANIGISLQAMNKDGFAFFASGNVVASPTTESYMGQVGFKLLW